MDKYALGAVVMMTYLKWQAYCGREFSPPSEVAMLGLIIATLFMFVLVVYNEWGE